MIPTKPVAHLVHANQYRAIRKRCLPLLTLAQNKPAELQAAIHQTIVCQIEQVLEARS